MVKVYEQFTQEIEIENSSDYMYTWTGRYNQTNEFFTQNGKFYKPNDNSLLKDMLYVKKFGSFLNISLDESISVFKNKNKFLINIRTTVIDKYDNNLYHMIYFNLSSYDLFIDLFEKSISTITNIIGVNSFSDSNISDIYKYVQKNI